jgi:hypothetical protein
MGKYPTTDFSRLVEATHRECAFEVMPKDIDEVIDPTQTSAHLYTYGVAPYLRTVESRIWEHWRPILIDKGLSPEDADARAFNLCKLATNYTYILNCLREEIASKYPNIKDVVTLSGRVLRKVEGYFKGEVLDGDSVIVADEHQIPLTDCVSLLLDSIRDSRHRTKRVGRK